MLYRLTRDLALRLMKAPTRPPEPPAGSHDSIQIHRASPRYLTYRLLGLAIVFTFLWSGWAILLLAGLAADKTTPIVLCTIAAPVLLVLLFVGYFATRIDYEMRYYIVTDRSMRVREGAIVVKEQTITYANVQNLRVVQGPLLRLFGIWNLEVDTAGGGGAAKKGETGGGHSIQMAGIENAHEVRDQVLAHLRRLGGGSGLGDLDDVDEARGRGPVATAELLSVLGELRDTSAALRRAAEGRAST